MARGRRTAFTALALLAAGAASIAAGRSIGVARQAAGPNYETGPFWADVIALTLGGAALFLAGAVVGLIWAIGRLRAK